MPHIIAEPCIGTRDTSCVEVCPVDCIHPTKAEPEFETAEQLYIDPDTCIDCGACVPECPFEAIFIEEEVPSAYTMAANQERVTMAGEKITHKEGDVVDLTADIQPNYDFYEKGPGYDALA